MKNTEEAENIKPKMSARTKRVTLKLTTAAIMLTTAIIFPTLFHAAGLLGPIFLPMHFPVFLCGILCGAMLGGLVGAVAPLISSLITGMPVLFPLGASMCFELMAYGVISGLLATIFHKKNLKGYSIIPLVIAMILGRGISGIFSSLFFAAASVPYSFQIFLTSAFVTGLPGIILQAISIPAIIIILDNNNIMKRYFPVSYEK